MFTENQCPKCGYYSAGPLSECPRCGIIVEKYLKSRQQKASADIPGNNNERNDGKGNKAGILSEKSAEIIPILKEMIFSVRPDMNPIAFWGRVLIFLFAVIWGVRFMFASVESNFVGESFLHLINLPFHEAGHLIFRPFGRLMTSLGGTLAQLLMPAICMGVFLVQTRDAFSAALCLWWVGENFMDIAPYINDARAGVLPLLGGNTGQSSPYGFHDWEFILNETGLLRYDHSIATASHAFGIILMLLSFAWGGWLLWKQYHDLDM